MWLIVPDDVSTPEKLIHSDFSCLFILTLVPHNNIFPSTFSSKIKHPEPPSDIQVMIVSNLKGWLHLESTLSSETQSTCSLSEDLGKALAGASLEGREFHADPSHRRASTVSHLTLPKGRINWTSRNMCSQNGSSHFYITITNKLKVKDYITDV